MTKRNFQKGTMREMVYDYIKGKKKFTMDELQKKFPKENNDSLRGLISTFNLAGIVKHHKVVWEFDD